MRRAGARLLALACGALAPLGAGAVVSCAVAVGGLSFGVYNPLSATPLNSTATLTTTCTQVGTGQTQVALTVSLSTGSSGSFAARTLLSGVNKLRYNLYQTAAYQTVWGDGTGGSLTSSASLHLTRGRPTQQVVSTLYGQIPAAQDVSPGNYLDTVVVTVNY